MNSEELDIEFKVAVKRVNDHKEPFPADTLLRLYAYFKRATNDDGQPKSRDSTINAFKTNALIQAQNISEDDAKKLYIELVKEYFLYRT